MASAVSVKNNLLGILNNEKCEIEDINEIVTALELTIGLWQELGYAYKGAEILERCYYEYQQRTGLEGSDPLMKNIAEIRNYYVIAQREHMEQRES